MGCGNVRIDADILKEVEKLLSGKKNKTYCISSAQFVNIAVNELLKKIKKSGYKLTLKLK